jgi:hypothetical protein
VAKATFLTSIMDEVPLTPKPEPHPPLGPTAADRRRCVRHPEFAFKPEPQPKPPEPPDVLAAESVPSPLAGEGGRLADASRAGEG